MKRCLFCEASFASETSWQCPQCGRSPERIDSIIAFAPELAVLNDGLAPDAHHRLDASQDKSFWFRSRNRLIADMARRFFPQTQKLLEIGCGTGYVLSGLKKVLPQARISGSEIYANGLGYAARRLGDNAELFQMDARHIPFAAEFDLIAACDVLEHIDDDESVLREIYRAVRPGGGVLLTVPQHPFLWSRNDELACHKRRYRRRELPEKVRRAGFKVLRDTSFVTTLLPLMLLQRQTQGRQQEYNPDSELSMPEWQDKILEGAMEIDRALIKLSIDLPVGGSRLVIATRPA